MASRSHLLFKRAHLLVDLAQNSHILKRLAGQNVSAQRSPVLISCSNLVWARLGNFSAFTSAHCQRHLSSAVADDEACQTLYFSGTEPAEDVTSPVRLTEIPGRGRGLLAARHLSVGDLVLLVQPVAVLHGLQDAMPSPDALAAHLQDRWASMPSHHGAALAAMYAGQPTATATAAAAAAASVGTSNAGQEPGVPSVGQVAAAHQDPVTSAPTTNGPQPPSGAKPGSVDIHSIVSYNAYGDEYEDLVAVDLRSGGAGGGGDGGGARSHVGLWPHFSSLNHSCAPNCVHYVVGSTMIVRAVQPVVEGSELMISYLGRENLAPRQVRQSALHSRYGFKCKCVRCRTEEQLPEELQALLEQLYNRARHELAPRFERLASAAAAAAGGPDVDTDRDWVDAEADEEAGGSVDGGAAAGSTAFGSSTAAAVMSDLTAAEVAKRALRQVPGPAPSWPSLLAALEPRLEECAQLLHTAVKELQEDDEATEEAADGAGDAAATPGPSQLTRVQTAQAASYQLLELLHLHAELSASSVLGPGGTPSGRAAAAAAAALQGCWRVLDAVSRGSELQVFQACKALNDALRLSGYASRAGSRAGGAAPPDEVREAAALLGHSLLARYGRLRGPRLTQMTQSAMRASKGFF